MKRWIDAGQVRAVRTAGGHRRVSQAEAVRFIRSRRLDIVDPAALGVQGLESDGAATEEVDEEALVDAFLSRDVARAERLIVAAYLRGAALPALFDGPIREAMDRLGRLWMEGGEGIMYEHRATDMLVRTLSRLHSLQPAPDRGAPVAVGGAVAGDPYLLPSMMAAIVLAEAGFAVTNLGPNTPPAALVEACRRLDGDFLWLSASTQVDVEDLARQLQQITAHTAPRPIALGGRGVEQCELPDVDTVYPLTSMQALSDLAVRTRSSKEP